MLQTGLTHTSVLKVEDAHTAANIGSGDMQVLATPIMMALMENAAMLAVDQELPTEQTTVGSYINCTHLKPSPIGAEIIATAQLVKVDGRKLDFHVVAMQMPTEDEEKAGKEPVVIGEGEHTRYIVDRERFLSKL
ncbi:MAG: thioesterase family protein [Prevotella sp.]|jgi:predicted thioesterase|nr:thioesterase family protein [Prevotella sp.]MBQ2214999.1 thioesterase family protein [Prevotella sp.]MBQ2360308.1 thioesterase family protein [Prevotella sp.]MBQ5507344.1 thioesterase family protein [Prevotella sp.]MBQ5577518.1 thioesterase family protein [Prevotella sp.]